jgi:hypothetical protein
MSWSITAFTASRLIQWRGTGTRLYWATGFTWGLPWTSLKVYPSLVTADVHMHWTCYICCSVARYLFTVYWRKYGVVLNPGLDCVGSNMHFHYCPRTGSIKPSLQYFHICRVRWLSMFPFHLFKLHDIHLLRGKAALSELVGVVYV